MLTCDLVDQLLKDQSERWHRGDMVPVEEYLAAHQSLNSADSTDLLPLAFNEYRLRCEGGKPPDDAVFLRRFPRLAPDLGEMLRVRPELGVFLEQLLNPQLAEESLSARAPGPVGAPDLPDLPGFRILEELGRGGMGVVYKATQTTLQRVVALKLLRSAGQDERSGRARFQAEAEAVARLQHPNIVQIYEIGEHEGRPFFSMEFCDDGTLAERLKGTPQLPRVAAESIEVIARAIHHAHGKGLVHRDLKPGNIMLVKGPAGHTVGPLGILKITDFGLVKHIDVDKHHTKTGAILGTPSYMAPEQAAGNPRLVGPSADVYSLGAILYECLTGRPPFEANTPLDTIAKMRSEEPVPPTRLRPGLSRDLEIICLKCLEKEPRNRYASALALADDLQRFMAYEVIRARPVATWERTWRWCRRKPALAGFWAAIVILALVGVSLP